MTGPDSSDRNDISTDDLINWIEFGSWTTIALAPFLYWINGPAVSTDQLIVRLTLISAAVVGSLGIRFWKMTRRRKMRNKQ